MIFKMQILFTFENRKREKISTRQKHTQKPVHLHTNHFARRVQRKQHRHTDTQTHTNWSNKHVELLKKQKKREQILYTPTYTVQTKEH